jgi:hypothetical protein
MVDATFALVHDGRRHEAAFVTSTIEPEVPS